MFIKNISIQGYGPFRKIDVPLWSDDKPERKVTILIGENGAGKSAFLEGIATLLSWLVARLRGEKNPGSPLDSLKIHHGFPYAILKTVLHANSKDFTWHLAKIAKGKRIKVESSLKEASMLASIFAEAYTQNETTSLPLVGFYPTERYVLDFPKKIRTRHTFKPINGYDGVLTRGIDFRLFFEWFRDREDIRNEGKVDIGELFPYIDRNRLKAALEHKANTNSNLLDMFSIINEEHIKKSNPGLFQRIQNRDVINNDPQYFAVLRAIENFMPGYSNLHIERKPRMRMVIEKDEMPLDILQLSQGERSLLALVGDIARRLAIMNPGLTDPLQGEGVVLIDEVDLHLHPRWQRSIVRRLRETFPNCQFILTTHSPLVISDADNIQVLALKDGEIRELSNLYGMDVEQVFLEIMQTPLRDERLQQRLDDLIDFIQDREFKKAKKLRQELGAILPPDHRELVRADIFLRRQEALHAKDN